GMGTGGQVLASLRDYEQAQQPGYLWMPLLQGEHISTDYALLQGEPVWWRHTLGHPLPGGRFDYWEVQVQPRPALEATCCAWLRTHLPGYSGMVNLETIGGTIIEGHLRFSDQWPDLYGAGWVQHLVELYQGGNWTWRDEAARAGFSVVLFSQHGEPVQPPHPGQVDALRRRPGISSIQITFHGDRDPSWHAMPPGGFRLAIVNCRDLAQGRAVRARLAELFGVNPPHAA
ncbi:MAG TPA: hypothetical protein VL359_01860, partial [bacterium]|nr:hypothetical protein [bacterium]